jgi:PST family polysaccharide transporter
VAAGYDGESAAPGGPDSERVFGSVRWVATGQFVSQGVRLLVSIALAHLLSPHDFGLLTMAGVFTAIGGLLSTLGAGPTIVQRPELSEGLLRSLATLGVAVGLGLWLVFALASGVIARFFGEPAVATLIAVLAANFALSAFGMVPDALLQRGLRFGRLVAIDMAALVVSSAGSVGMAALGYGVWSLVLPNLAATWLKSLLLLVSSPWRPRLGFDASAVSGVLGFGGSVLGFNALLYFTRNADRLIIGRALGAVQLGLYDYAYRFYSYPVEVVTGVLISVMSPTFSRLQHDRTGLGRGFLRANGAIALVTFPMMTGLFVVAAPFVRVVLGEQWTSVIPLVRVLAPLGALQSLGATPGQIFLATGNAALRLWWAVIYTIVIVLSFAAGLPWGVLGVASAYAIVMVPITLIGFWLALRLVDLRLFALWRTLASTISANAAMALVVGGAELWLRSTGAGDVVVLLVCVPLGAVVYAAAIWWLRPEALEDVLRLALLQRAKA